MTFHELIQEAHGLGLRVESIYEIDGGSWRATMKIPEHGIARCADFGEGETPEEALRDAIDKARRLVRPRAASSQPKEDIFA